MKEIVEKELSYKLTGICFKIHNELERFLTEKQYCDALATELQKAGISFEREPSLNIAHKEQELYVGKPDFVIENRIVLDVKAKKYISKQDYYQMMKYLSLLDKHLGLIVNFRSSYLKPKRIINPDFHSRHSSVNSSHLSRSAGQSLIETIVAIFVLVTGLIAGLDLAIFSFGASSTLTSKISATSLAREGIEAVRRTRDSNWLAGTLTDCGGGKSCYTNWLTGIDGTTSGQNYRMIFYPQATASAKWGFEQSPASLPSDYYQLYKQASGGLSHFVSSTPTNFFRKIIIIRQSESSPYSAISPLVLVRSSVWWHGKNCPNITDLTDPGATPCKIISEEYLTNWKNY